MRRRIFTTWAGALLCWSFAASAQTPIAAPERPALVLLVAIDQFRYDYLPRFRSEYTGGLKLLLDRGAVFVNCNLEHYPTVTAVGHSTMLTGATPTTSGIIGNDWYDRESGKRVTSVSDDSTKLLGGPGGRGSSPRRLLVSTVGDELKRSGTPTSKVIGLSLKDRSAVLPAGHMADAAYWYSEENGDFVSSTYFFPELPAWVRQFNQEKHGGEFAGKTWMEGGAAAKQRVIPAITEPKYNAAIYGSPYGNDLLESFAERAIEAEQLGRRGPTDLLTVSFSSNDAIGHTYGPDSPEVHAVSVAVDRSLGHLLTFLDKTIGLNRVLVALTADHAVSPGPDILEAERMPGGRMKTKLADPAQKALEAKYGPGNWVLDTTGASLYLNRGLIADQHLEPAEVQKTAARAIAALPEVARVYTREQMLAGRYPLDRFEARVLRGFNPTRSGDVEVILYPYWIRDTAGATHGTPYNYDSHIPLIFMGAGIHPGRYYTAVALNDLAPTVAALLDVEIPSGSSGRVLDEIWK